MLASSSGGRRRRQAASAPRHDLRSPTLHRACLTGARRAVKVHALGGGRHCAEALGGCSGRSDSTQDCASSNKHDQLCGERKEGALHAAAAFRRSQQSPCTIAPCDSVSSHMPCRSPAASDSKLAIASPAASSSHCWRCITNPHIQQDAGNNGWVSLRRVPCCG